MSVGPNTREPRRSEGKMSDLMKLAKRCEAATGPDRELDADIWMASTPGHSRVSRTVKSEKGLWPDYVIDETRDAFGRLIIVPHYSESLDAALTLVPEGWTFGNLSQSDSKGWWCELRQGHLTSYDSVAFGNQLENASPALAVAAAALRARAGVPVAMSSGVTT
jgi:hypothetical protein